MKSSVFVFCLFHFEEGDNEINSKICALKKRRGNVVSTHAQRFRIIWPLWHNRYKFKLVDKNERLIVYHCWCQAWITSKNNPIYFKSIDSMILTKRKKKLRNEKHKNCDFYLKIVFGTFFVWMSFFIDWKRDLITELKINQMNLSVYVLIVMANNLFIC